MPHLVLLYTGQLDAETDIGALCRTLADTMLALKDDDGTPVFPIGGTRVLAYPAPHFAVADGAHDCAFVVLNLRMGRGRSDATQQRAGAALADCARAHFDALLASRPVGITLQVDVGTEVFDARLGNLHSLFSKR